MLSRLLGAAERSAAPFVCGDPNEAGLAAGGDRCPPPQRSPDDCGGSCCGSWRGSDDWRHRAALARDVTSEWLGVLALALQRELVAVADQHDVALVGGRERGAMTDRDDGACRQFLLEQTI